MKLPLLRTALGCFIVMMLNAPLLVSAKSNTDTPNDCTTEAVTSSGHTVKFLGVVYSQGPNGCQSTWSYEVTGSDNGPAISHVNFGGLSCASCLNNDEDILDATVTGINNPDVSVGQDGSTPYCGIKFDDGWDEGESRIMTFTMNGAYDIGTIVFVAKAGPGYTTAEICGPVCAAPTCETGTWNESTCGCETVECTISLSGLKADISCHGENNGSIDLTVSGAQGSVSYEWSDGATSEDRTGLAAGTYSVTVTDEAGCTATESYSIAEPAQLIVSGVKVDESSAAGSDGSIDLTVSGGTEPYSFLWNDGSTDEDRSNLPAGTYSVTVTDANGCGDAASFEIKEYICTITVDAGPDVDKCHNEPTMLNAVSSDPNAVFSWEPASELDNAHVANPVTNVKETTTFTVTATGADGCQATDEVTVTAYDLVKAKISVKPNTNSCQAPCVKLFTPNNPDYVFEWRNNGIPIAGAADKNTYCACESGSYSVHVVNSVNGCAHTSKRYELVIEPKLEAGDLISGREVMTFKAWPNPAADLVNISLSQNVEGYAEVQLLDWFGRKINVASMNGIQANQTITFNMQEFAAGLYIVRVVNGTESSEQKVMLIK